MKQRFSFRCWKCERIYTLFKEITTQQELIIACPFCNQEAVVKLEPYRREIITVLKQDTGEEQVIGYEYQFPDVFPTQKRV